FEQVRLESGAVILVFAAPPGGSGLAPGSGPLFSVKKIEGGSASLDIKRVHMGGLEVIVNQDRATALDQALLPRAFSLQQNVPNPFNPSTSIRFAIPPAEDAMGARQVRLTVYNLRGSLVTTLLEGPLEPGFHTVTWQGTDSQGRHVPSGIYFYRLCVEDRFFTRKMILLK
ncbi:MAG: FlgD immunoglobulin-like domain containing protein, partial [Gemmatimonadota bacterium]|nr:FlgD immunoglobulin-like domain containing protein [Gemmatimonadota bacterium]